ncbi:MAG: hypothetical protein IPK16_16220 [Anaerolineales bacterium]|nr:hypothetical protein [Anaerolineales bacterium]
MKRMIGVPATLHENLPYIEVSDRLLLDDLFADSRTARCFTAAALRT